MYGLKKHISAFAWALCALVFLIGSIAWGQGLDWKLNDLSAYDLFPLFGILAFSLMWTHYIVSAKSQYLKVPYTVTKDYFRYTSLAVLAFILLHPGILIWQLWRDGFGLPPNSYLTNYVAAGSRWAALLGSLSLFIFLAYEFHRKYKNRTWWKYVSYGSDAAMIFVFFHAIELGPELAKGWFRTVWFFYGASYLVALVYIRMSNFKLNKGEKK